MYRLSGNYSISRNTLHWDIQLLDLLSILGGLDLSDIEIPDFDLNDFGVQRATVRLVFNKQ